MSVILGIRAGTNDAATLHSTFLAPGGAQNDEYGLAAVRLEPDEWALDVGAHIGSVAFAIALDNPGVRVMVVEPVPENVDLLRENVSRLGMEGRVFVHAAAAGAPGDTEAVIPYAQSPDGVDPGHAAETRYIGNLWRNSPGGTVVTVPCVSIASLLAEHGVDEVAFTKIDCEGAEWRFLDTPEVARLRVIVGEWHDRPAADMVALLSPTHEVDVLHDGGGVGLFRAVRRD